MTRWFRSHAAKLESPKIQKLTDAQYRAWDSLLCVACRYDGVLPPLADTAFLLRKPEKVARAMIDLLVERKLLVRTERGIEPHQWNEHQYKSDVSTDRVKAFRERRRNVSVTPSETDTDTDTDIPLAKANGHSPPVVQDITAVVFGAGLKWLAQSTGKPEAACRALLGKWRQQSGDEALIAALGKAQREGPIDAVAWMTRALKPPDKVTGWN